MPPVNPSSPAPAAHAAPAEAQAQVRHYQAASYSADDSVGYLMKRVLVSMVQQADKALGPHALTSAQWMPLMLVRKSGQASVAEMARWANVDAGAMTRLLDRLERKGLCQRTRSGQDRRVVQVVLTEAGEAAIAEVPAALAEVMNGHLIGFSHDEWQLLKSMLQRMLANGEGLRQGDGLRQGEALRQADAPPPAA